MLESTNRRGSRRRLGKSLRYSNQTNGKTIHPRSNRDLSENQYCFRKDRSTVDALLKIVDTVRTARAGTHRTRKYCLVVTLDVWNAFNSDGWSHILQALRDKDRGVGIHHRTPDGQCGRTKDSQTQSADSFSVADSIMLYAAPIW